MNLINEPFRANEKLYRAVLPIGMFIKDDGSLTSAALRVIKGNGGLSVDRQYNRSNEESVETIIANGRQGDIYSVLVEDCHGVNAVVKSKPVEDNAFHCEIHRSEEVARLTKSQAKHLAMCAKKER